MSRYDWSDAPKWATAGATDQDGRRFWFQKKPTISKYGEWAGGEGRYEAMDKVISLQEARESIEFRPEDEREEEPRLA